VKLPHTGPPKSAAGRKRTIQIAHYPFGETSGNGGGSRLALEYRLSVGLV
jgi:hypothetical protein